MSVLLAQPAIQVCQVGTVVLAGPGLSGFIARVEARLQGRRGPRILQPYYDIVKLFRKESVAPERASWVFLAAPLVAFASYLAIPLLIPVLTSYGLTLGYMGDILGGGFLLALSSFVLSLAAAETGSPYAQIGSSRTKSFGAITEPVLLFVFFTVAFISGTDLPYSMAATVRANASQIVRPGHILVSIALFMVILFETSRIPVEAHSGTNELGMIEEARSFEYSGPYLALTKWGSAMKQMIFYVILINIVVAPWGLASTASVVAIVLAVLAFLGKAALVGIIAAVIDDSFSKLRLFKISEFVVAAFLLTVLGVFVLFLDGGS